MVYCLKNIFFSFADFGRLIKVGKKRREKDWLEVLDVLFCGLEASPVSWTSFIEG
jgi:hypothetical protein